MALLEFGVMLFPLRLQIGSKLNLYQLNPIILHFQVIPGLTQNPANTIPNLASSVEGQKSLEISDDPKNCSQKLNPQKHRKRNTLFLL